MKILLYIWLCLELFISCSSKQDSINQFFIKANKSLTNEQKIAFKKCKGIEELKSFIHYNAPNVFLSLFDSIPKDLNFLLSDSLNIKDLNDRKLAILLAFHKNINNFNFSFADIKIEIDKYNITNEQIYLKNLEEEIRVQTEIALNNYRKYKVGDTINLMYPVKKVGTKKEVFFNNFYYNKNYDDTLYLKCFILKKEFEDIKNNEYKRKEFYFLLRIVNVSNSNMSLIDNKYSVGKEIILPIYIYGRPI